MSKHQISRKIIRNISAKQGNIVELNKVTAGEQMNKISSSRQPIQSTYSPANFSEEAVAARRAVIKKVAEIPVFIVVCCLSCTIFLSRDLCGKAFNRSVARFALLG